MGLKKLKDATIGDKIKLVETSKITYIVGETLKTGNILLRCSNGSLYEYSSDHDCITISKSKDNREKKVRDIRFGDIIVITDEEACHKMSAGKCKYGERAGVLEVNYMGHEGRVLCVEESGKWRYYLNPDCYKLADEETEIPTLYKVLVVNKDGELVSSIAGRGLGCTWRAQHETPVVYKEGEISYAPAPGKNLFAFKALDGFADSASSHINGNPTAFNKGVEWRIHEATPLGTPTQRDGHTTYPALLLGKEVRRSEPVRPEPKFKVGDCVTSNIAGNIAGSYIVGEVVWGQELGATHKHWHYRDKARRHSFYDEEWLKLVEETWVDVTKECTLSLRSNGGYYLIDFIHNRIKVAVTGSGGGRGKMYTDVPAIKDYQLEFSTSSTCGNWFRLLHKEYK